MHLLIDIKGHGRIADADVPRLEAALEVLQATATAAGLPLRVDFAATQPDPPAPPAIPTAPVPEAPPVMAPGPGLHLIDDPTPEIAADGPAMEDEE